MATEPLLKTNKEGEDLADPLPKHWDLESLRKGNVPLVFYGMKISPPSCKIRFMLNYYGVPYESKIGKKPNSDYTKIPVLDMGDRQINDSYIIVKNLAPILQGRKLTEKEEELEKFITSKVMIALERDCASSIRDLCGCGYLAGGGIGCAIQVMAPVIACCHGPKIGKDKDLDTLENYKEYLQRELGPSNAFFGGSEPSVIDVSMFGFMLPFEAAGSNALKVLLGGAESPLSKWFENMHRQSIQVAYLMKFEHLPLPHAMEVCSLARPAARPREVFLQDLRTFAAALEEEQAARDAEQWDRAKALATVDAIADLGYSDVASRQDVQRECRRLLTSLQEWCIREAIEDHDSIAEDDPRLTELEAVAKEAVTEFAKSHGWTKLQ